MENAPKAFSLPKEANPGEEGGFRAVTSNVLMITKIIGSASYIFKNLMRGLHREKKYFSSYIGKKWALLQSQAINNSKVGKKKKSESKAHRDSMAVETVNTSL